METELFFFFLKFFLHAKVSKDNLSKSKVLNLLIWLIIRKPKENVLEQTVFANNK